MFEEYRKAYDEMEADPEIWNLRDDIKRLQNMLIELESPYRERMGEAEESIKAAVLEQCNSVTLFNVEAQYRKGRVITSWKKVADDAKATQEMIDRHTKTGKPSVIVTPVIEK